MTASVLVAATDPAAACDKARAPADSTRSNEVSDDDGNASSSGMQQDDALVRMASASAPTYVPCLTEPSISEVTVKVVVAVLGFLLALPALLLLGLALGPVILVILFISGIALLTVGLLWMLDRARTH